MNGELDYNEVYLFLREFGADYLNRFYEIIIDSETNTYASIKECKDIEDVKMRVIYNLCRPIGKGLEAPKADMLLGKINTYFSTELTKEDMVLMYGALCYREKFDDFKDFIRRGFPVDELKESVS